MRTATAVKQRPQAGVEPAGRVVGHMPGHLRVVAGKPRTEEAATFSDGLWCPISREEGPTFERLAQGDMEKGWQEGREKGSGYRRVDPLKAMLNAQTITDGQHWAGTVFRNKADTAVLDPLRAGLYGFRIGTGAGPVNGLPHRIESARTWIANAVAVLGGHSSQLASVTWYVVGLGWSIRRYQQERSWHGRVPNPHAVAAKVEAALSILEPFIREWSKVDRDDPGEYEPESPST